MSQQLQSEECLSCFLESVSYFWQLEAAGAAEYSCCHLPRLSAFCCIMSQGRGEKKEKKKNNNESDLTRLPLRFCLSLTLFRSAFLSPNTLIMLHLHVFSSAACSGVK